MIKSNKLNYYCTKIPQERWKSKKAHITYAQKENTKSSTMALAMAFCMSCRLMQENTNLIYFGASASVQMMKASTKSSPNTSNNLINIYVSFSFLFRF